MKRLLLLVAFLPSLVLAEKGDVSAPAPVKMAAAAGKAGTKPAPATEKRVLHLELKK